MRLHRTLALVALTLAAVALAASAAPAVAGGNRLKDLVDIEGFRGNTLTGFGIVVGLNGTGDDASSPVVRKSMAKMLKRLGITVTANDIKAKNVAAVMVTAELPAFARAGSKLDVTISSMGAAKSLSGGTLIATPLKGADVGTYAIAQGSVSTGGFAAVGASGSSVTKNHVTAARIPDGAIIERDAPNVLPRDRIVLVLRDADFTTATRIVAAIDAALGAGSARVRDPGAVEVVVPKPMRNQVVGLIAKLEAIEAEADAPARVVIDERSGTVVVGANVRLGIAAVASGSFEVVIKESSAVSQPGILAKGDTAVTQQTDVAVKEASAALQLTKESAAVADVAAALNALGAKPRDLVSVLQSLKAAGALRAELVVL